MTAQAREKIYIESRPEQMAAEPMLPFLFTQKKPNFIWPNTARWHGYYGSWELKNKKLFLISLSAYIEDEVERSRKVGLDYLFPRETEVFASWYGGIIKIEMGDLLEYVHSGYSSVYAKEKHLVLEDGILVDEFVINNQNPDNDQLNINKLF